MLAAVYKSSKKADTYLYVERRDDFSSIPEPLMATFGKPQFVMLINMRDRKVLGGADIEKVRNQLAQQGFYLQIPPPNENLLEQLRNQNGANSL
ncbi:YcgL domain-containing protein [Pseudoalteromonas tunicata]|jgi:uncharacterized protein YcgL (UPF0745 family)|uniref:YcgL domain-containing protein PTD2_02196 n=1 Tax=Pseudoalteromonas tunicata D2 TaxID=87626 RepID=A4C460_9GAMM|nr:YcgL domain-containing protein [Pseudoalteromonas tunicata]ATC97177.1 hypothetical protein PTUN_b0848 [Pseudoalteromonas tunicata]AXT33280.1 YcgL domain-containing protein [Pseudoalteromonas tunicata]EAR30342.1 hypothetical protein PTD2_02196 [Pseudoalteromonas tunicata D2]MDP4984741.1 YcgL domain-containing protein [Pseudoalteromonas tunicata]MDP5214213.1 YcgL domain-containing protein [Pseudoalteromonas tunicata]